MSMEVKAEDDPNSADESSSRVSQKKSRRIRKSPKPSKTAGEAMGEKRQSTLSAVRTTPQFGGVFESEMQKQSRLEKFWLVEIDNYYRKQIQPKEVQMLSDIISETVPSLRQVIGHSPAALPALKVPFEEMFRYVQLIHQCRSGGQLLLLENQHRRFLAVFAADGQLDRILEVSPEEAFLLSQRSKFLSQLEQRQNHYNATRHTHERLSEITSEVAFLLHLMRQNKDRIDYSLERILERIEDETTVEPRSADLVRDKYISCLIRKNLRIALMNTEVDYLNYFANLDAIQQHGSVEPEQQKLITDKKEFEEYMKRKRSKKSRKNMKGILKTACAACLSPHYEQYNPLLYCSDCHVRFHKYCYTPLRDGLCEPCFHKKEPVSKGRVNECQLCPNRGLLSFPMRSTREPVSIHVFCMLVNGLWRFENGALEFKSTSFVNQNTHSDLCTICNSAVYTYPCMRCPNKAHPLCAYLAGWNIELVDDNGLLLQCCEGVDQEKQSYRRKFILNYKKILYKSDRER